MQRPCSRNTTINGGNLKQRNPKYINIPKVEYLAENRVMAGAAIEVNIRDLRDIVSLDSLHCVMLLFR
jgi:hypothetical protein